MGGGNLFQILEKRGATADAHGWRKAIARDLKQERWNQEEIARLFGVAQNTVSGWLNEDGMRNIADDNTHIPDSRVKIPKEEHSIILKRATDGDPQDQIASDYGVNQTTISRILTKETKRRNREALIQGVVATLGLKSSAVTTNSK